VLSTVILVLTYAIVAVAAVAFGGVEQLADSDDVLAVLGTEVLGDTFVKVLIIAVLTSAAASTQTTILPTARTTLSMAAYQALPASFAKVHPKFFTPTTSTIAMGAVSIVFYVTMAALSDNILADSALAVGLLIAFYYGLTGFASAWYFRNERGSGFRDLNARIIMPLLGGLMLLGAFIVTLKDNANPENSATQINLFGWQTGGVFLISVGALLLGIVLMVISKLRSPAFFTGAVLNRDTVVKVYESEPITDVEALIPSLPDAPSQEQTVIPPLSVEELREAEATTQSSLPSGSAMTCHQMPNRSTRSPTRVAPSRCSFMMWASASSGWTSRCMRFLPALGSSDFARIRTGPWISASDASRPGEGTSTRYSSSLSASVYPRASDQNSTAESGSRQSSTTVSLIGGR